MKMNRTKVNKALCWFWILVKLKLFNIYLSCSFQDSIYISTLYVATGSKFFSLNKLLFTTCSLMWIRFHIEKTVLGLTDSEHIFFPDMVLWQISGVLFFIGCADSWDFLVEDEVGFWIIYAIFSDVWFVCVCCQ